MTDADLTNIDRFNRYAGFFLAKLYNSFPVPTDLDSYEAVYLTPMNGTAPDGAVSNKDLQRASCDPEILFCSHALNWLRDAGYFKGDATLHNIQVHRAVLTAKGLEALNAAPDFQQSKPLGRQLTDTLAGAGKDAGRAAITAIMGQIVGFAARELFRT